MDSNSVTPGVVGLEVLVFLERRGDRETECPRTLKYRPYIAERNESVRGHQWHRSWLTPQCLNKFDSCAARC